MGGGRRGLRRVREGLGGKAGWADGAGRRGGAGRAGEVAGNTACRPHRLPCQPRPRHPLPACPHPNPAHTPTLPNPPPSCMYLGTTMFDDPGSAYYDPVGALVTGRKYFAYMSGGEAWGVGGRRAVEARHRGGGGRREVEARHRGGGGRRAVEAEWGAGRAGAPGVAAWSPSPLPLLSIQPSPHVRLRHVRPVRPGGCPGGCPPGR